MHTNIPSTALDPSSSNYAPASPIEQIKTSNQSLQEACQRALTTLRSFKDENEKKISACALFCCGNSEERWESLILAILIRLEKGTTGSKADFEIHRKSLSTFLDSSIDKRIQSAIQEVIEILDKYDPTPNFQLITQSIPIQIPQQTLPYTPAPLVSGENSPLANRPETSYGCRSHRRTPSSLFAENESGLLTNERINAARNIADLFPWTELQVVPVYRNSPDENQNDTPFTPNNNRQELSDEHFPSYPDNEGVRDRANPQTTQKGRRLFRLVSKITENSSSQQDNQPPSEGTELPNVPSASAEHKAVTAES